MQRQTLALVAVICTACGDNQHGAPSVGPLIELPLLESQDQARPYNHSAEVSVAASNGRVVVAAIQFHLPNVDSYDIGTTDEFRKRVAVYASADGGQSFGAAIDPALGDGTLLGDQTTDPCVRAAADGSFFATALRSTMAGDGVLARSSDGESWAQLAVGPFTDKPWLVLDDANQQAFVGAVAGLWRYGMDGTSRTIISTDPGNGFLMADGYAASDGVRFAASGTTTDNTPQVIAWDGIEPAPRVITLLDPGAQAQLYTTVTWSLGPLKDGVWSVRARLVGTAGSIVLRVETGGSVVETTVSAAEANAFMPAAVLDSKGRIHIVWYDSAGPTGKLVYTHSRGTEPFGDGFSDPIVIDPNATPGNGWYPGFDSNSGARRLREYIGLAVDGNLLHLAWTHSPAPPSRVYVTTVRLD